jgi:hypothetical protein
MTSDTEPVHSTDPQPERFEDRLLRYILTNYDELRAELKPIAVPIQANPRPAPRRMWVHVLRWTAPAVGVTGAVAMVIALTGASRPHAVPVQAIPRSGTALHAIVPKGNAVLYRLAAASAQVPASTARYLIMSETDTDSEYAGQSSHRTSVDDSISGSSITYQEPFTGQGLSAPGVLREGPSRQSTTAWYESLPTDPTALRAWLLSSAKAQYAQAAQYNAQAMKKQGLSARPASALPSDDDLVYEQASDMLWGPLVPPALRSALYKVLATTSGVVVDQNATDPDGRPAVEMTRTWTDDDNDEETNTTYENPANGAVLSQIWKVNSDTTTAVYQPVTSSNTIPPDPYGN